LIFQKLGSTITKRYRLIVPLWIVALVVATPLIMRASSAVSLQQGSTSNLGLEAQVAQRLVDTQFGASGSGSSLVVVISSSNATSRAVHDYVIALSGEVAADPTLPDFVSAGSAYSSVSSVLGGVSNAEARLKIGASLLNELFYGTPGLFIDIWSSRFGANQSEIPQAQAAALKELSMQVLNQTELLAVQNYLNMFVQTFSASFQTQPGIPLTLRASVAINESGTSFINTFAPAPQRAFALLVLRSFNLSNFTDPAALESFVLGRISKVTIFTPQLAAAAYVLTTNSSASSRDRLVESVVNNPIPYNIPPVYKSTISGFVSPDHTVMLTTLEFRNVTSAELSEARRVVQGLAPRYGLAGSVRVTGQDALSSDITASILRDTDLILPITIVLLIVATGLFFRSVVTPFVSLGTISIALGLAEVIVFLVATYVSQVDVSTPTILLTVLIGVGTDYSIFILARYREERVRGAPPQESVENSVTWAGESIATSGATVIISFIFLGFQPITFLRGLGLVVGLGVLIALLAALTLIPSIVLLLPKRIFFPISGTRFEVYASRVREKLEKRIGYFSRSGRIAIKHAKLIVLLSLFVTIPAVYVWANLVPSYDFLGASPKNLESVSAFNSLTSSFGAGTLFPTYVVAQFSAPIWNGTSYNAQEIALIDQISNTTLTNPSVLTVAGPTRPGGARVDFSSLSSDPRSLQVISSMNKMLSQDDRYALLTLSLKGSPYTEDSISLIRQLRAVYASLVSSNPQYLQGIFVGGAAGTIVDTSNVVNAQFYQVIGYVTIAVAVVLLIVLGSLFLPLFAIVSVVMSIAWTLAATRFVFGVLYNFPILYITPLTLFVLLLGLGMDYNIFILTRIREEATKGKQLNEAITTAIENTGGIITAAAIILAGSLGALSLSSSLLLKEFGFAFFFSILIDAMVMRTYIVPAVMSLMGRWNWYAPGRVQRVKMK